MSRYIKTPEHRAKISKALTGRIFTSEHRANISAAARGRVISPETRAKMSAARVGNRNRYWHGMSGSPTHNSWHGALTHCNNPKSHGYSNYGGRGITVCERWTGSWGFVNFLADMGERPEGKTLDRVDPNGNYEPSNCRWATPKEQSANRRGHCPTCICLKE